MSMINGLDERKMKTFYLASLRRSEPPKFRPVMILLVIFASAVVFAGLTMTVISYYPGYSSPSKGGNALRIAGPVMLAVGGVFLIGLIVESCYAMQREIEKNEEEIERFKSNDHLSIITGHSVGSEPKSILKAKAGSRSQLDIENSNPYPSNLDDSQRSYKIYSVSTVPDMPPVPTHDLPEKVPPQQFVEADEYSLPRKQKKEVAQMARNPPRTVPRTAPPLPPQQQQQQAQPNYGSNMYDNTHYNLAGMGAGVATAGSMAYPGSMYNDPQSYHNNSDVRYDPTPINDQEAYDPRRVVLSASKHSVETEI